MLITSQDYLDDNIINQKIENGDFTVLISPEFVDFNGNLVQVILDGHHSYAASLKACVEPVLVEATKQDNDKISLLEKGQIEEFLEVCWMGVDYYCVDDAGNSNPFNDYTQ